MRSESSRIFWSIRRLLLAVFCLSLRAENGQSMTYAMVVKVSIFAANQARLMASGAQILAPGANGFYESISAASRLESGDKSTEWTVILAVFDEPTSKIKVGTSPIVEGVTGLCLSGRNILGGQGSALATTGLVGGYAFIRAYDRALNNTDIEAISIELTERTRFLNYILCPALAVPFLPQRKAST